MPESVSDAVPPPPVPTLPTNVLYVESNDPAPGQNTVLAYRRAADGSLAPLAGSPFRTGGTGVANPTQRLGPDDVDQNIVADAARRLLFVANGGSNTIAVLRMAADGALTYVTAAANSGAAICWVRATRTGRALYTSNTLTNSVSRYDATSPLAPVERQHLVLREPGPAYPLTGMPVPTSQSFQLALAPDERTLYVVSQHASPDFAAPNGNWLHAVAVAADGTMSEAVAPLQLPVATRTRPRGVVVF